MNRIDQLVESYRSHIQMPLRPGLAAAQRVWFAVYSATDERRLVNRIDEFEVLTKGAGHPWVRVDLKGKLAEWIDSIDEEERAEWFKNPGDIDLYARTEWKDVLTNHFKQVVAATAHPEHTVFALTGLMDLYDFLHVSELIEAMLQSFRGYLLVFFPGFPANSRVPRSKSRTQWTSANHENIGPGISF